MTLPRKDWSAQPRHRAMSPTEVVTAIAKVEGWRLSGDGPTVAIEKRYDFKDFHDTMAFVNAVAFIAHTQDHHPHLGVDYNRCVVRFNTHDAQGITSTDFDCAARVDALLATGGA